MLDFTETQISQFVTHVVGNKLRTEGLKLSDLANETSETTGSYLLSYFLSPFKNLDFYSFNHNIDLEYNEIYSQCCKIFDSKKNFLKQAKNFAKHLYEHSLHPKIKSGELTVVYFENCIHEDEIVAAIGVFKTETKDLFLKINSKEDHFVFKHDLGININKLEKGCLIFNVNREKGFKVLAIDKSGSDEAQYWRNDFLNLKPFNNEYTQTKAIVEITKAFVGKEIDKQLDLSKKDKIAMLNRSQEFLRNSDIYNEKEYVETILDKSPAVYKAFKEFRQDFALNSNIDIETNFNVSENALKKSSKIFKSTIKLDKNFIIHIQGSTDLIDRGFDKENGKNYYKFYFDKEL